MQNSNTFIIEIEICSEAIFTAGEKERNLVQSRAQTDLHGFIYFHAKTLKGQLKKQAFWLLKQYVRVDKEEAITFYKSIDKLFGLNSIERDRIENEYKFLSLGDERRAGLLRLSNLELDKKLREFFILLQKEDTSNNQYRISSHDLIEAQTHIRTGIQVEDGIVKDKMFNTFHTVRKGLVFYSTVIFEEEVSNLVIKDFAKIVHSFRRIGAGIHRGRGEIKASLLRDNLTTYYNGSKIGGE